MCCTMCCVQVLFKWSLSAPKRCLLPQKTSKLSTKPMPWNSQTGVEAEQPAETPHSTATGGDCFTVSDTESNTLAHFSNSDCCFGMSLDNDSISLWVGFYYVRKFLHNVQDLGPRKRQRKSPSHSHVPHN